MKKLFVFAAAIAALVSCTKSMVDEPTVKGTPMTVTASLDNMATKISLTDEDGLKGSWDATETISVVSIDGSFNILAIDHFTSTGAAGRKSAEFTGTITSSSAYKYIVYYPALTVVSGDRHKTPEQSFTGTEFYITDGSQYSQWSVPTNKQEANDDCSHIKRQYFMAGEGTVSGSNISVEFVHMIGVLKFVVTVPDAAVGKTATEIDIDSSIGFNAYSSGWGYLYDYENGYFYYGGSGQATYHYLKLNNLTLAKTNTFYMPISATNATMTAGTTWDVSLFCSDGPTLKKTLTWNADKKITNGSVYRFNFSVE